MTLPIKFNETEYENFFIVLIFIMLTTKASRVKIKIEKN